MFVTPLKEYSFKGISEIIRTFKELIIVVILPVNLIIITASKQCVNGDRICRLVPRNFAILTKNPKLLKI